jgi:hypothetical protein
LGLLGNFGFARRSARHPALCEDNSGIQPKMALLGGIGFQKSGLHAVQGPVRPSIALQLGSFVRLEEEV